MPSFIQAVIDRYAASPVRLLDILRELQSEFQYISTEATECVAKSLNIPRTQIISVIEFYSFLHATPQGKYALLVSDSITDHMRGKQDLMSYFASQLQVTIGELRADGLVSACTNKPFFEKYHTIFMEYFLNFNSAPQKNHQFLRIA